MSAGNIRRVNLQQIHRPKTLIVIHYKSKRVSIPLFQTIPNITEYLCHQLHKFQTTILQNQQSHKPATAINNINNILGFTSYQHYKDQLDIKMNILLSFSRPHQQSTHSRTDLQFLDISSYYKYLQLQPYYGTHKRNQLIPQYQLFSVLSTGSYYTVYLGRKISDGRFYSIKISTSSSPVSLNEYNTMKSIHHQQSKFTNKQNLQLIPQIEQVRKTQGLFIYIYEYCPGGTLHHYFNKKITELQCLHYMKQLVWGIHLLHQKFNFIHRALCFENIQVDFIGNLRLYNYAYCQPCYSQKSSTITNIPETYQQQYQISSITIPPEVSHNCKYNHLVDIYGIGAVLYQMLVSPVHPQQLAQNNDKEGLQKLIANFMAENIKQRELFYNQIVTELQLQKSANLPSPPSSSFLFHPHKLPLPKIYTGSSINIQQKPPNGITHEQALKLLKPTHDDQFYYLHPVNNKYQSKSKKKYKNQSKNKIINLSKSNKNKSKNKIDNKRMQNANNTQISNSKSSSIKSLHKSHEKSVNKSMQSKDNSKTQIKVNNNSSKNKQTHHIPTSPNKKFIYNSTSQSHPNLKLQPPLSPKNQLLKPSINTYPHQIVNSNKTIIKF